MKTPTTTRARTTAFEKKCEARTATRRTAFLAATDGGRFHGAVALLLPLVRELLLNGGIDNDRLLQEVDRLVGPHVLRRIEVPAGSYVTNWAHYCHALSAAYALGVAMGQQVVPGFFEKGGAR